MSFRTFLMKLIKGNLPKFFLFFLSAIFSMTVFFVFANLWFTDGFLEHTNQQMHTLMVIAAAITILFSVFIISYVHWHLLRDRAKSFSVLLSYGMSRKDLKKLIAGETLLIYIISMFLAFFTGSVFSKLFFLMSMKLLMLENSDLTFELTGAGFLFTAAAFAIIFLVVLLLALIRLSKKDFTEISKLKNEVELNGKGNLWVGCLGILLVLGSILILRRHNQRSMENLSEWILGTATVCLFGMYLLISHFSRLLYGFLRKNTRSYYGHLLAASEFARSYRQNRMTLFILTLLTYGAILFISVTYTLNREAYHMTQVENPHDLYFQKIEAFPLLDDLDFDLLAATTDITIAEKNTLPFVYLQAPDLLPGSWRDKKWVSVVSESSFNQCFRSDYDIIPGTLQQIIYESTLDHHTIYFNQDILLTNARDNYRFESLPPLYHKILNRYLFPQPLLLIADDQDYQKLSSAASSEETGVLYLYQFDDWKNSKELCSEFTNLFYDKYDEKIKMNQLINKELVHRYDYTYLQVRSKVGYYDTTRMQGAFSLFIMGFVSILFCFCILITYCFKVFMNTSEDRERFRKLDGIGMMAQEKKALLSMRIRLLLFVPAVLGSILVLLWIYALNFKSIIEIELSDTVLLQNVGYTGLIYFIIIFLYYCLLNKAYHKRLGL